MNVNTIRLIPCDDLRWVTMRAEGSPKSTSFGFLDEKNSSGMSFKITPESVKWIEDLAARLRETLDD